jgi:TRAP-type C4-dicarboxylate transport system permease small subunit
MIYKKNSFMRDVVRILEKIEDGILIGLLLLMIFLAVLQIVLRNLFDAGILWGDPLIRIMVLWIGLMGAMIASRNNHHISIDVISRFLPSQVKRLTTLLIAVFTSAICAGMAYFGLLFVMMERTDGFMAFSSIPVWICESIIPISFAIISIRYILLSFTSLANLIKRVRR